MSREKIAVKRRPRCAGHKELNARACPSAGKFAMRRPQPPLALPLGRLPPWTLSADSLNRLESANASERIEVARWNQCSPRNERELLLTAVRDLNLLNGQREQRRATVPVRKRTLPAAFRSPGNERKMDIAGPDEPPLVTIIPPTCATQVDTCGQVRASASASLNLPIGGWRSKPGCIELCGTVAGRRAAWQT